MFLKIRVLIYKDKLFSGTKVSEVGKPVFAYQKQNSNESKLRAFDIKDILFKPVFFCYLPSRTREKSYRQGREINKEFALWASENMPDVATFNSSGEQ